MTLEYSYARSLGDFTEYLGDMENALDKAKYVATATGQASVAATLRESSGGAKAAMSYLPFSQDKSAQIEKSISILGDFALYIGTKSARGEALSPDDYQVFETLREHVKKISLSFTQIREEVSAGKISVGATQKLLSQSLSLPAAPPFDDGLSDLSKELSALPTMLYDGPFSDHIEKREPEFLKGKPEIDEATALEQAAAFLKVAVSTLSIKGQTPGNLAAYEIEGDDLLLRITKKGGAVLYCKKNLEVPTQTLGYEEALAQAKTFLTESGFPNMQESYYVINDNTCTINFAAQQEDVVLYSDLIKVTIELHQGGMVEFSANGYLMNHKKRGVLIPELDENTASQSLSEYLKIEKTAVALVPTAGENETLCYEFTCRDQETPDKEIIVYLHGSSGLEEQIYLITESDGGKLVS